jgi:hypothetical protein
MNNHRGNIRNLRFRYTKKTDRIIWTQGIYPYARFFLNLIREIPWNEYSAVLESLITIPGNNNNNRNNINVSYVKKKGTAVQKQFPYYIFGGAACEILNYAFPTIGNLHNFADPTADIDVILRCPLFKVSDNSIDYDYLYNIYRKNLKTMSPLANNYINWLFDRIIERLPTLAKHLSKNSLFELPSIEEMYETSIGTRFHTEGPLLVSLMINDEDCLIKIQISTKYAGVADHIVEFILNGLEDEEVKDHSNKNIMEIEGGLIIADSLNQLSTQLDGLIGRQEANESIIYKLINHYGRIMFLTKAIRWLADNGKIKTPYWGNFNPLLKAINNNIFKKKDICPLPIGCSLKAIIEPIAPFLQTVPSWKNVLIELDLYNQKFVGGRKQHNAKKTKKLKKQSRKIRKYNCQ